MKKSVDGFMLTWLESCNWKIGNSLDPIGTFPAVDKVQGSCMVEFNVLMDFCLGNPKEKDKDKCKILGIQKVKVFEAIRANAQNLLRGSDTKIKGGLIRDCGVRIERARGAFQVP